MTNPFFFGYGSLVNKATHDYPNAAHATAHGWRRAWVSTPEHGFAFLTAVRAPDGAIDGLIAEVPNADWAALDLREAAYDRIPDSDNVQHSHAVASEIAIYAVPSHAFGAEQDRKPILLSYLDVVLQGYLQEFGTEGAQKFVASTDRWDTPVLDDRATPHYPRSQILSADETQFVNDTLRNLGSDIIHK